MAGENARQLHDRLAEWRKFERVRDGAEVGSDAWREADAGARRAAAAYEEVAAREYGEHGRPETASSRNARLRRRAATLLTDARHAILRARETRGVPEEDAGNRTAAT